MGVKFLSDKIALNLRFSWNISDFYEISKYSLLK